MGGWCQSRERAKHLTVQSRTGEKRENEGGGRIVLRKPRLRGGENEKSIKQRFGEIGNPT